MKESMRESVRHAAQQALSFTTQVLPYLALVLIWPTIGPHLIAGVQHSVSTDGWPAVINAAVMLWLVLHLLRAILRARRRLSWQNANAVPVASSLLHPSQEVAEEEMSEEDRAWLYRRARHEAAHAVSAWSLGAHVERMDLKVTDVHAGQCIYRMDMERFSVAQSAWLELVTSLIGNEIDLRDGWRDSGSRDDLRNALGAAAALISAETLPEGVSCELSTDALMAQGREAARALLDERSGLIEAVAQALLSKPERVWMNPDLKTLAMVH